MNKIESYVDSLIPEKIPKIKKIKIRDEFLSHIYDQIDFYMEIGYSIDQSVEKALENMGNDEETKDTVKKQLTELHFERNWWGVVTFFVMLLLNWCSFYLGAWVFSVDSNYPEEKGLIYSFCTVFLVIIAMTVFYRLGMRKCLMGLGFANLSICLIFFWAFYPQAALYSLLEFVCYLLDKYTSIAFGRGDEIPVMGVIILTFAFLIAVTVACFALSKRIKKRGKPEKKGKIGLIVFSVIFAVVGTFSSAFYNTVNDYFESMPYWICCDDRIVQYPNDVSVSLDKAFGSLNIGMEYSETEKILKKYGLQTLEDYSKSLSDKNIRQAFNAQFNSYDYFYDDYEIWIMTRESDLEISVYTLYTKKGDDGKLIGKGTGNADEDIFACFGSGYLEEELAPTIEKYKSLKKGEDKDKVLKIFLEEFDGVLCSDFKEQTANGLKEYYRISCSGLFLEKTLPGSFEDDHHSLSIYLDFTFIDGKLTSGSLNYYDCKLKEHRLTV